MRSDISKIKQSESLFVRDDLHWRYFDPFKVPYGADRFSNYRYEIHIPLIPDKYNNDIPKFNSIKIKNISPHMTSKEVVITADKIIRKDYYKDKARFGEFIFLLAAKLKYDLLCEGLDYSKAGFLYSRELERLYKAHTTQAPPSILKTLSRYYKQLKDPLIKSLFFDGRGQFWHVICRYGKYQFMYWLNADVKNIHFVDENKQEISGDKLTTLLAKIFPSEYLIKTEEFEEFVSILQEEKTKRLEDERDAMFIVKPEEINNNATSDKETISKYPIDFSDFIKDRTKDFVDRDFIFKKVLDFIDSNPNGYFIIKGDPGIGKSSIMARLAIKGDTNIGQSSIIARLMEDKQYVHHFNIASSGITKASTFLRNICTQLIINYQLNYTSLPAEAWEDDIFLNKLLCEASGKIKKNEKIIIIVDSLDEVDVAGQSAMSNVLYLPRQLPEKVYIIATARDQDIRLRTECKQEPWLIPYKSDENKKDIRRYIENRTGSEGIKKYIKKNKIKLQAFIDNMLEKSEGNFMYLRCVLPEIGNGAYQNLDFEELPSGLENYYKDHWRRMNRIEKNFKEKIKIIYVLSEAHQPVSVELLMDFTCEDSIVVQSVLDEWEPFLHKQKVDGHARYSIYHSSFRDFLNKTEIIKSARINIRDINDSSFGDSFFGKK
ncbi:MAG: hypothetical protein WC770_04515 [Phycisphaerae bacterium]